MKFIPRLFVNDGLFLGLEIKVIENRFHYLINVLRKSIGDDVFLINGVDGEFLAKISDVTKKYCTLRIEKLARKPLNQKFLGLIFSPIKNIEIIAKMSTELGVTNFFPIITEYTNKNNFREEKFLLNVIEAVEQSERLDLPKINKIDKLENILNVVKKNSIILFCEERTAENDIKNILNNPKLKDKNIYALVGGEGGFSDKEKDFIKKFDNCISVGLGDLILRSETAIAKILSIASII